MIDTTNETLRSLSDIPSLKHLQKQKAKKGPCAFEAYLPIPDLSTQGTANDTRVPESLHLPQSSLQSPPTLSGAAYQRPEPRKAAPLVSDW